MSEIRSNVLVALNVLQLKVVDDVQQDTANLTLLVNLMRTSHLSDAARDWLEAPDRRTLCPTRTSRAKKDTREQDFGLSTGQSSKMVGGPQVFSLDAWSSRLW
jgi:hypothetical protein